MLRATVLPEVRLPFHKRLLLVDDEHSIRATLPPILKKYGFVVTAVGTVAEALEEIRTRKFDILICDLNIEGEADGLTVVRAMRDADPECMTLILTGYPAVETAEESVELGVTDYVAKPASADFLVALLAEKLTAGKTGPPKPHSLIVERRFPAHVRDIPEAHAAKRRIVRQRTNRKVHPDKHQRLSRCDSFRKWHRAFTTRIIGGATSDSAVAFS